MEAPYPAGPATLPAGLTAPNSSYKRSVWLAVLALGAFVGLYFGLIGWLAWRTWGVVATAFSGGSNSGSAAIAALPMLFLLIFLLKALFFRDRTAPSRAFEVTREQEPVLFDFLNRVADDAGAPRPHKVFLAPEVNAAVFYDVSVLNLLFPSRKNLRIGLGLVNALSLSELKAVLAHEFGHFGQRAMAVGSWVYTAQRIAAHIVAKRDIMDRFLMGISRLDLRIAWVGWLMRIIVWALRSVVDTVFSVAVLAERALTRKMEFQADLVAVSLTGSDAIVHALHRLGPADSAFDQAVDIVMTERTEKRAVTDLFQVQTAMLERLRSLLGDRRFGPPPPVPEDAPERHRIFEKRLASPPRMWSTHPPNEEREENAKRIYVPAPTDERPAWALFRDPAELRRRMTSFLSDTIASDPESPESLRQAGPPQETVDGLAPLARRFDRIYCDAEYRGTYLKRSVVRMARTAEALYPASVPGREEWETPYTDAMVQAIERLKAVEEEHGSLLGLQRGLLQTGGGSLRFRGRLLRRRELPEALALLTAERDELRREVAEHDRRVRGIYLAAAEAVGQGWPELLRSAAALLHYADHTEADLNDAAASFRNVLAVVTADGRVSSREAERLCAEGVVLQHAMQLVHDAAKDVVLTESMLKRFEVAAWHEVLPTSFGLPTPYPQILAEWCENIGDWIAAFAGPLDVLERFSLEQLLETERRVMRMARGEEPVQPAPAPARVPASYTTILPGHEREKQWRLDWWDRFQVADGFGPTVLRFAVSGGVVAFGLWAAMAVDAARLALHNGLNREVTVKVGSLVVPLGPYESVEREIPHSSHLDILTTTASGEVVEEFTASLPRSMSTYVYNVAGADALVQWTAVYGAGHGGGTAERHLGAPRWTSTEAAVLFMQPPTSVRVKRNRTENRVVLQAPSKDPETMMELVERPEERQAMMEAHARWDRNDRQEAVQWVGLAAELPGAEKVAEHRLAIDSADILAHRLMQDGTKGERHRAVCDGYRRRAQGAPDDGNLAYLSIRCMDDGPEQDEAFVAAHRAHPEHPWLATAASYALSSAGRWEEALEILEQHDGDRGLPEQVVIETARLMRLARRDTRRLRQESPIVAQYLALEDPGKKEDGVKAAYVALARGRLDEALAVAAEAPPAHADRILRLVAGSSGAPQHAVRKALALPPGAGVDFHTVWPALGLALHAKRDVADLRKALAEHLPSQQVAQLQRCVDRVAAGVRPAEMDGILKGLPTVHRGHVLVMATVAMGERAPAAWRDAAMRLLFVPERPWLEK